MKKIYLIVNYFICFFIILFIYSRVFTPNVAADEVGPTPTASPYQTNLNVLTDLMNIFLGSNTGGYSFSQQQGSFNLSPALSPTTSPFGSGTNNQNLIFYPQCDGNYDNYPLPSGCNLCQSGCGPTTAAMVLSSYVDKKFTPDVVVDLYKQNNFYAGCDGTKIIDAQTIIQQNGLKTTDLLYYGSSPSNEAIQDLKSYIQGGWTIFVLTRFCEAGCAHYFWITDIDNNNNVWAFDPFYGRKELPPPFNENRYSPFPKYRIAFGVKKM